MIDRQRILSLYLLFILTIVIRPLTATLPTGFVVIPRHDCVEHKKRQSLNFHWKNHRSSLHTQASSSSSSSLPSFDGKHASTTSSSCPFSRTFPRYRINLSTIKDENNGKFKVPSWPWQRGWSKNQMEQKAKAMGAEFLWKENMPSLDASAMLWRSACHASGSSNLKVMIAFPDTRPKVIRQWLDIFQWLQQVQDITKDVDIDCSFDMIENIPCIIMQTHKVTNQNAEQYDHKTITIHTKAWVKRILVEQGICPFTKSVSMSGQGLGDLGIPVGSIVYHTSSADSTSLSGICTLMADTWEAICDMTARGPKGKEGVSSILLAAPSFDDNFALWSGPVFCLLENQVIAAEITDRIGVVCFHPHYQTPDGQSFPGFGHMHSVPRLQQWMAEYEKKPSHPLSWSDIAAGGAWQRRTPHATINVLRADQLAVAEGRRSTPTLYSENILKLWKIGSARLQQDLDSERQLKAP